MLHHFLRKVKSNSCGEMSCLLKQWLVINCTEDILHLNQCNGMYVYKIYINYIIILINNMQNVTFLFCIDPIIYENDRPGRGALIWTRRGLGGGCLLGGECLLEGRRFICGNMICAWFCVVHIAFIIFADFCLFLKSKKHMQKTLWHHFVSFGSETKTNLSLFCKINSVEHL